MRFLLSNSRGLSKICKICSSFADCMVHPSLLLMFRIYSNCYIYTYVFSSTNGIEKAIANLAIYLFILYKLLPQVQKVYLFSLIYDTQQSLLMTSQRIVKEEYKHPSLDNLSKTTIKNIDILEFKEISFTYPGSNDCIFSNLNLKLLKGNYYAIVGESGTEKQLFKYTFRSQ